MKYIHINGQPMSLVPLSKGKHTQSFLRKLPPNIFFLNKLQ